MIKPCNPSILDVGSKINVLTCSRPAPVGLGLTPMQYSLGLPSPQKKDDEPGSLSNYQPSSTPHPSSKEDEDDGRSTS